MKVDILLQKEMVVELDVLQVRLLLPVVVVEVLHK
jgi:hypothetical protein